jgi:hypothetical protein
LAKILIWKKDWPRSRYRRRGLVISQKGKRVGLKSGIAADIGQFSGIAAGLVSSPVQCCAVKFQKVTS